MAYPHQLYPCGHQFCGACLHKHLAARLTCPKPGCGCVTQPECSTARCGNPAISRSPSCAYLLVLTSPARHCMPPSTGDAVLCTCISHSCTAKCLLIVAFGSSPAEEQALSMSIRICVQ